MAELGALAGAVPVARVAGLALRRMGHPEEVAAAVAWLSSEEAGFIVGHVLCADGGFVAG